MLLALIRQYGGWESCHVLLPEGLHSFFDGARSQLFCLHVSSVQLELGSRAKQPLLLVL